MDFTELHCDGCGKKFEAGDDIVTCPECGTPQHRECYKALGGCVNAAKHELGFEWKAPEIIDDTKEKKESIFDEFRVQEEKKPDPVRESLNNGELPEVDDVVEQRVNAICPGITAEQRKEQVCGADIGLTASFVGNGAANYMNKFRKMERIHAKTFNWGAFFLSPFWFFWRKQYKLGIIFGTIDVCLSLLVNRVMSGLTSFFPADTLQNFSALSGYQSLLEGLTDAQLLDFSRLAMIFYAIIFVEIAIHVVSGFIADKFYYNYIKKSIYDYKFIRGTEDNETALKFYLSKSSTSFVATMASILVVQGIPYLVEYLSQMF